MWNRQSPVQPHPELSRVPVLTFIQQLNCCITFSSHSRYIEPTEPRAGTKVKLSYNRKASPLHWVNLKEGDAITLRWGVNGWKSPKVVNMARRPVAPSGGVR